MAGTSAVSFFLLLGVMASVSAQDCKWSINNSSNNGGLPKLAPLYIKPESTNLDIRSFWLPQSGDEVTVKNGEKVLFACPGSNLGNFHKTEVNLTCVGNSVWKDESSKTCKTYTFDKLECKIIPSNTAKYTGSPCINDAYKLIKIGFQLTNNFYTLMKTCFDSKNYNSIYSEILQTPHIKGVQRSCTRPKKFKQDVIFYPYNDEPFVDYYTYYEQKKAVTKAIGETLANELVKKNSVYFLSRGHLTANADFVYGVHQKATFWFMNVAPQWQTLNGGNWNTLEGDVRTFSENNANNLYVYTGTSGVTSLRDEKGVKKDIYLHTTTTFENEKEVVNNYLKVPSIFWKVVYDPVTKKGVAFGGMNNPYIDDPEYLCTDICNDLKQWKLNWDPNDQRKGYTYCCDVNDMAKKVPEIPKLEVEGLLGE